MGLITYPRLNLRCEEHRKGRKAAYTSYFIISISDLSFQTSARIYSKLPKCSFKQ